MENNTYCYWGQLKQHNNSIVPTRTILHPCLDVMSVTDANHITNIVYNRNQARKALKGHPIFLTDSDHNFIIYEIKHIDTIIYEINISVDEIYE